MKIFYGPTDTDPDRGAMYHRDCGGRAGVYKDGPGSYYWSGDKCHAVEDYPSDDDQ